VIVGHSERRKWLKETDQMINKKIKLAIADGLAVILCVGEPLSVRRKNLDAARAFVRKQIVADLRGVKNMKQRASSIVIAYEPIWAIGTGRFDNPTDAGAMAAFIKAEVKKVCGVRSRVLYGGSVNRKNVADYITLKEIDGALVGGASLKASEFSTMISVVSKIK
jgi:triosephosphate isomerase